MQLVRAFTAIAVLLVVAILSSGCATHQRQVNQLGSELQRSTPELTLAELTKMQAPDRDRAHFLLNRGSLELLTGDFAGSINTLQSAKRLLERLQALSISENLAAGTINETLRAYAGTAGERVMLQEILAINYLMLGDLDGARVECLQADVLMNQLARNDSVQGQLASARFVAGLVFELLGEWDNAMISYRKAAQIMRQRGQALPTALEDSLLSISQRQQLRAEYKDYVAEFGRPAPPIKRADSELLLFYWDGVVSAQQQRFVTVYVPELRQNISLALPYYPPNTYRPRNASIALAETQQRTEVLEDIETLARNALDARQGQIYAMTLARILAKQQAVRAAQRDSELAGILANLATIFTEVADTRSWNMLPSSIQVMRTTLPAGRYAIQVPGRSGGVAAAPQWLDIGAQRKVVALAPQASQRVFSYSMRNEGRPR